MKPYNHVTARGIAMSQLLSASCPATYRRDSGQYDVIMHVILRRNMGVNEGILSY